MKVHFLIGSLRGGGAERVLSLIANELSSRNYDVTISTYIPVSMYSLDEKISFKPAFSEEEMKETRLLYKIIRRSTFYWKAYRILKESKPDVVISFVVGMNRRAIFLSKILGVPVIVSEHTSSHRWLGVLAFIERYWLYRVANAVTILTNYDYDIYYKKFLTNGIVMPNPVSFESIQEIEDRDKVIICAGSLDRWADKGFDNLLKIFAKVTKGHPSWKMKIAGSGEKGKKHLEELVDQYNIKDKVEFLGFCQDMSSELQKASIFVLSSLYEGFPMVLVEAMSQGCACVSYDCDTGPNEIIKDNIDGILVENQNMDEMEKEICKLIDDEALRKTLSSNAIKNIQRFSIRKIGDRWVNLINEVTNSNKDSV